MQVQQLNSKNNVLQLFDNRKGAMVCDVISKLKSYLQSKSKNKISGIHIAFNGQAAYISNITSHTLNRIEKLLKNHYGKCDIQNNFYGNECLQNLVDIIQEVDNNQTVLNDNIIKEIFNNEKPDESILIALKLIAINTPPNMVVYLLKSSNLKKIFGSITKWERQGYNNEQILFQLKVILYLSVDHNIFEEIEKIEIQKKIDKLKSSGMCSKDELLDSLMKFFPEIIILHKKIINKIRDNKIKYRLELETDYIFYMKKSGVLNEKIIRILLEVNDIDLAIGVLVNLITRNISDKFIEMTLRHPNIKSISETLCFMSEHIDIFSSDDLNNILEEYAERIFYINTNNYNHYVNIAIKLKKNNIPSRYFNKLIELNNPEKNIDNLEYIFSRMKVWNIDPNTYWNDKLFYFLVVYQNDIHVAEAIVKILYLESSLKLTPGHFHGVLRNTNTLVILKVTSILSRASRLNEYFLTIVFNSSHPTKMAKSIKILGDMIISKSNDDIFEESKKLLNIIFYSFDPVELAIFIRKYYQDKVAKLTSYNGNQMSLIKNLIEIQKKTNNNLIIKDEDIIFIIKCIDSSFSDEFIKSNLKNTFSRKYLQKEINNKKFNLEELNIKEKEKLSIFIKENSIAGSSAIDEEYVAIQNDRGHVHFYNTSYLEKWFKHQHKRMFSYQEDRSFFIRDPHRNILFIENKKISYLYDEKTRQEKAHFYGESLGNTAKIIAVDENNIKEIINFIDKKNGHKAIYNHKEYNPYLELLKEEPSFVSFFDKTEKIQNEDEKMLRFVKEGYIFKLLDNTISAINNEQDIDKKKYLIKLNIEYLQNNYKSQNPEKEFKSHNPGFDIAHKKLLEALELANNNKN